MTGKKNDSVVVAPSIEIGADDSLGQGFNWVVFKTTCVAIVSTFNFGYALGVINLVEHTIRDCPYGLYYSGPFPSCIKATPTEWGRMVGFMPLGGIAGSLAASIFSTKVGRRNLILYNNIFLILGFLLVATAVNQVQFSIGRFIMGIGAGLASVTVSSFIGETANVKLRGTMGTLMQLSIDAGIMISQIIGFFLNYNPGWRVLFGIPAVLAVIQSFLLPFCPKSPPHLVSKGNMDEARKQLQRLRPGYNIDNEFEHILEAQINIQHDHQAQHGGHHSAESPNSKFNLFREIRESPYPKFLFICCLIHMNQMFSGINSVAFYSTTIFTKGFGLANAEKIAVSLGAMQVLAVFLTVWAVDNLGRRPIFLASCVIMFISLILIVVGAELHQNILMLVATFIFMAGFALGIGPIPYLLISELFPSNLLTFTSSFVIALNWTCNAIVGFLFPVVFAAMGNYTFLLFAGFLCITTVCWFLLFKETKGKTLDTIIKEGMKNT